MLGERKRWNYKVEWNLVDARDTVGIHYNNRLRFFLLKNGDDEVTMIA